MIGEGAHTTIHECLELKTRKTFAVKIWKNAEEDIIKDIKHSFLLLKQLDHPYLLKVEDLYIEKNTSKCFLVSEICNYHDLRYYLK